ncbi:hypothetical protein ACKVMT_15155 [Halobacteriales archaeon Cl-PHB]
MQTKTHRQEPTSTPETDPSSRPRQSIHDVFSNPYRAAVLYHLQDADGPVPVDDVVDQVLVWSPDHEDDADRNRIRSWLVESHVLRLAELGLVRRDREADTIRLAEDVSVTVTQPWRDS